MPSKKKTKKVAPAIKMNTNPLTRKRRNRSRSRSKSRSRSRSKSPLRSKNKLTKKAMEKVNMNYNPVRDCGSIGGAKKKTRKSCGCNKSWFF